MDSGECGRKVMSGRRESENIEMKREKSERESESEKGARAEKR